MRGRSFSIFGGDRKGFLVSQEKGRPCCDPASTMFFGGNHSGRFPLIGGSSSLARCLIFASEKTGREIGKEQWQRGERSTSIRIYSFFMAGGTRAENAEALEGVAD
ncbi:hypothetical protein KP509_08G027800 [Ceratopteris richardii]|uniref:Uncharacterized protein n=1 Tax=Ceratopteris richardii TaxID=49495 RepID=A0A8T2U5J9_CERRI|nr:hypothetical protein KP509_08G027800 [Ceratopteris richardii]